MPRRRQGRNLSPRSIPSEWKTETPIQLTAGFFVFVSNKSPLPDHSGVADLGQMPTGNNGKERAEKLERTFREHVERWKSDTQHLSSVTKMLAHPSYLRVIGLAGESADHEIERLLLAELREEPDYWFDAMTAITGENPVGPDDDFDAAVNAWLEWGRGRGFLSH
jgi:hypothetical protein